jgi:hypothetical protein
MTDNLPATLNDDFREQLLRQQGAQLTTVDIPRVKIMAAGAGLYEFTDTNDTVRDFEGVILSSHARNTLWDRPYGSEPADGEAGGPGCTSGDGQAGRPREGFEHQDLDGKATGSETITCGSCAYNQWGSASLVGKNGKGKACTNQRSVYLLVEGKELPYEMILSPTSLREFDAYSATLLNQGLPLPAVVTKLGQQIKTAGSLKWAQATFEMGAGLTDEAFSLVREKMVKYKDAITPRSMIVEAEWTAVEDDDDEEAPF